MGRLALVLCVALCANAYADTTDPAGTAREFLENFNAGNVDACDALHTSDAVIVDEFAPFQWEGPGTFRTWLDTLMQHDAAAGVTDGHMAVTETVRQEVSGDHAYVILATVYSFKEHGTSMRAPSQMTFAMRKSGDQWRISAWTYSAATASPVGE